MPTETMCFKSMVTMGKEKLIKISKRYIFTHFRVNVREHVRHQPVIRLGQLLSFLTIVILIEYNLKRAKERLIEL